MPTTDRRFARNQALPPSEAEILRSLRGFNLYARVKQLFDAGWTLRAIGEAFDPPKARSTVASWVEKAQNSTPTRSLPAVSAPTLVTPPVYIPVKPVSPRISIIDGLRTKELAPIARKYRAGMSPLHKAALANANLTELCTELYDSGVTISELAKAADVTYRAMAKRLGKA